LLKLPGFPGKVPITLTRRSCQNLLPVWGKALGAGVRLDEESVSAVGVVRRLLMPTGHRKRLARLSSYNRAAGSIVSFNESIGRAGVNFKFGAW